MHDLERVRFVTTRYRQLRGLHLVVWAVPTAIYLVILLLTPDALMRRPDVFDSTLFLLLVCLPVAFAQAYLKHYYESRFGRVGQDEELSWDGLMLMTIGWAVGFAVLGASVGTFALLPAAGAVYAWAGIRDVRYRAHCLIGLAGALIAMTLVWMPDSRSPQVAVALLVFCSATGVVGWLDHRLLVRTLGGRRRPAADRVIQDAAVEESDTRCI